MDDYKAKRAAMLAWLDRMADRALRDPKEQLTPHELELVTLYLRSHNVQFLNLVVNLLHGDEFEVTDD